jgi:hypothetical protein
MKNFRDQLKSIIREQLEDEPQSTTPSQKLGSGAVSATDASKSYRDKAQSTAAQQGIDNKERAIIQQIETNLQKLADLSNIKSGNVFSILNRLNKLLEDQIQKLEAKK